MFKNIQKAISHCSWQFIFHGALSTVFLFFAVWLQNTLSVFTDIVALNVPVGDVMFSVIPKFDLSVLYFLGMWLLFPIGLWHVIFKIPEKIPFIIFTFGLFFFMRGLCIASTFLGVPPDHITPHLFFGDVNIFTVVHFFRNDLFFSGHTGIPFLIALFFWNFFSLRIFFIIVSMIMAFTVLSMRIHYTIDIIGAYFITYGVYKIAEYVYGLFPKGGSTSCIKNKDTA